MDSSKMNAVGWNSEIVLDKGIENTYQWFLDNQEDLKEVKL
jgi:GDP-L-fucose synthase